MSSSNGLKSKLLTASVLARVGVPDHAAFGVRRPEEELGIALVDVADQAAVDAVSDQLQQARREAARDLARDAELLVLLLPDPPGAVVHRDADAALLRRVRAAAVPQAAVPDEHASPRHPGRDAIIVTAEGRRVVAQVRTGDDARRPVGLGEVGERPHGVAHGRDVRLRQREQLIVGMDRLRPLTRVDADRRQRRHQAPRIEHAIDDRQDLLVDGDLLIELSVYEQVVDAHGVRTLEGVSRGLDLEFLLEALEIVHQGRDQLRLDDALEDRVSVARDALEVAGGRVHGLLLSHWAPWMRSRVRIRGSRPSGATSTASLKKRARQGKIYGSLNAITARLPGTALVLPIARYSRKGGMAHHDAQTLIGRRARRRPSRVRRAERGGRA